MKSFFINFTMAVVTVTVFACAAEAQIDRSIAEIKLLRQKLSSAIERRDRKALESLYTDDFTHTHASGQVDDKQTRLAALISGEPTIESAKVDEVNFRAYNKTSAIATGKSSIDTVQYRWTLVYIKTKDRWQIAASQATRIAEK